MSITFQQMLEAKAYSLTQEEKQDALLDQLSQLTQHHYTHCEFYRKIIDAVWGGSQKAEQLADIPYLPVSLFKQQQLASVPQDEVSITLTSSGTTGAAVSQIFVDRETSTRQQRALTQSMMHVLGPKRLPMLVIDSESVFKNPKLMSARGAGVLGMTRFGHRPVFALTEDMKPNLQGVRDFLQQNGDKTFFIFGFTFMVWSQLYQHFASENIDLKNGILVHSGGWKKMIEESVDNKVFRSKLNEAFGLTKIFNFYGMVEQLGSVFLEGDNGLLYPPSFSEVIIRDPKSWRECPNGTTGVIQVLSLIPRSYPGHSLLTEDIGVIEEVSSKGQFLGKGLRILGRVKKAELRGCSDVIASEAQETSHVS